MYTRALDTGMFPWEFWDCSLAEVNDLIESHERQKIRQTKTKTVENCQLGYIISTNIGRMLNGEGKNMMPWDVLPELFAEEQKLFEQRREEEEFESYKQRKREYAAAVNKKRREV